jgi:hypothetical protein
MRKIQKHGIYPAATDPDVIDMRAMTRRQPNAARRA